MLCGVNTRINAFLTVYLVVIIRLKWYYDRQ